MRGSRSYSFGMMMGMMGGMMLGQIASACDDDAAAAALPPSIRSTLRERRGSTAAPLAITWARTSSCSSSTALLIGWPDFFRISSVRCTLALRLRSTDDEDDCLLLAPAARPRGVFLLLAQGLASEPVSAHEPPGDGGGRARVRCWRLWLELGYSVSVT